MTSKEYWQKRETEHAKKNKMSEQTYAEEIRKTYAYMADQIQKEIDGFYAKYANAEKISLAEAKRRVSKLDIEEYGRKAAKYVKEKDFSDQANEEMRLYNATMKINRLELLKANIGLEMVSGFDELQKYFDKTLTQQTIEEFRMDRRVFLAIPCRKMGKWRGQLSMRHSTMPPILTGSGCTRTC